MCLVCKQLPKQSRVLRNFLVKFQVVECSLMLNAEVFCIFEMFGVSQDSFKSFNEFQAATFLCKSLCIALVQWKSQVQDLKLKSFDKN